jgi:alkyl hydroperoxide reductase subunit AhpF
MFRKGVSAMTIAELVSWLDEAADDASRELLVEKEKFQVLLSDENKSSS